MKDKEEAKKIVEDLITVSSTELRKLDEILTDLSASTHTLTETVKWLETTED